MVYVRHQIHANVSPSILEISARKFSLVLISLRHLHKFVQVVDFVLDTTNATVPQIIMVHGVNTPIVEMQSSTEYLQHCSY
jgi:hypothetical protein